MQSKKRMLRNKLNKDCKIFRQKPLRNPSGFTCCRNEKRANDSLFLLCTNLYYSNSIETFFCGTNVEIACL